MDILKPAILGRFKTINRLVRSATCEYLADNDGRPGSKFIELYNVLARAKIGIVITGYSYVLPNGKSNPGQSGIYKDELIPVWKEVSAPFKNSPSLFLLQIVHGGRQVRPKHHNGPIWAPSAIPDSAYKTHPQEMSTAQIEEVIDAFIKAGIRAEKAGFDGIQLHAAHGYLLSQFLSPYTNRRNDDFGGDQEKRTRVVVEILRGIKARANEHFILSVKINGEDCLFRGLSLKQAIFSARLMKEAGIDFIEVSGGMGESKSGSVRRDIERLDQEGYFRNQARVIKQEVNIPTAVVGGFRTLNFMQQTVKSGDADLISLCRPFVREPDLVFQFEKGKRKRASCVSCNRCFNPRGLECWQIRKE